MGRIRVPSFQGIETGVSPLKLGDTNSPDCSNVRLNNPYGALNTDIGMSKWSNYGVKTGSVFNPITAIHQLKNKRICMLEDDSWWVDEWENLVGQVYITSGWFGVNSPFYLADHPELLDKIIIDWNSVIGNINLAMEISWENDYLYYNYNNMEIQGETNISTDLVLPTITIKSNAWVYNEEAPNDMSINIISS